MPSILVLIALVTGATWMTGEHALFGLGMDTTALTDWRSELCIVFLGVTALLLNSFAKNGRRRSARRQEAADVEMPLL
jgi:hypothetical protein